VIFLGEKNFPFFIIDAKKTKIQYNLQ